MQKKILLGILFLSYLNIFSSSGPHTPTTATTSNSRQFPTTIASVQPNIDNQTESKCPPTDPAKLNLTSEEQDRNESHPVPPPFIRDPFEESLIIENKFSCLEQERNLFMAEYLARIILLFNFQNQTNNSQSDYETKDKALQANHELTRFCGISNINRLTPSKINNILRNFRSQLSPVTCEVLEEKLRQSSPETPSSTARRRLFE
jgi:hypothetical protein